MREIPESGAPPPRRILVAVDDSAEAEAALGWALDHVYR
jgi:nucleotide-binding universal stress UspA family protein